MPFLTLNLPFTSVTSPADSAALRTMTSADLVPAAALWLEAYPLSVTKAESHESVIEDLAAGLNGGYGRALPEACLVARDHSGVLCGVIQTTLDVPWSEAPQGPFVIELYVSPVHRNRGLGTALLAAAGAVAHTAGHETLSLQVDADNVPAAALYARLGFLPASAAWRGKRT